MRPYKGAQPGMGAVASLILRQEASLKPGGVVARIHIKIRQKTSLGSISRVWGWRGHQGASGGAGGAGSQSSGWDAGGMVNTDANSIRL